MMSKISHAFLEPWNCAHNKLSKIFTVVIVVYYYNYYLLEGGEP